MLSIMVAVASEVDFMDDEFFDIILENVVDPKKVRKKYSMCPYSHRLHLFVQQNLNQH